jgi:hypothetical protein
MGRDAYLWTGEASPARRGTQIKIQRHYRVLHLRVAGTSVNVKGVIHILDLQMERAFEFGSAPVKICLCLPSVLVCKYYILAVLAC